VPTTTGGAPWITSGRDAATGFAGSGSIGCGATRGAGNGDATRGAVNGGATRGVTGVVGAISTCRGCGCGGGTRTCRGCC
jgi:hypothetical protein